MEHLEIIITSIIVCYGESEYLYSTIDSVLKQKQDKIEIIVSDDGSGKFNESNVLKYINDNKGKNIVACSVTAYKENVGTVKNINRSIKLAKGKYIKLIGGDDVYHDEYVFGRQIEYLDNNSNIEMVTGYTQQCDQDLNDIYDSRIDETNKILEELLKLPGREAFRTYLHKGFSPFVTQAMCYRKSFFDKYTYFDERFLLIEDSPMGAYIFLNEVPIALQKEFSVRHRTNVGVSAENEMFSTKRLKYYKDVLKYTELFIVPNVELLGNKYVNSRYNITKFRVEYCEAKCCDSSFTKKAMIIIKNSKAIMYFFLLYPKKVLKKMIKTITK